MLHPHGGAAREFTGGGQSGAPVADSGQCLAIEHARSMANPSGHSGLRIGARLGLAAAQGGASSSARLTRCSRRKKGRGMGTAYLLPSCDAVAGRRCRREAAQGGIVVARRWPTSLLRGDSQCAGVGVGGCGLGDALGLRAELLLQLTVVGVRRSTGNTVAGCSAPGRGKAGGCGCDGHVQGGSRILFIGRGT